MPGEKFLLGDCYVCGKPPKKADSYVFADDYNKYLNGLLIDHENSYDKLLTSEHANFVNAVTWNYFKQFYNTFRDFEVELGEEGFGVINFRELFYDDIIDMGAHKYRLKKVLEKPLNKYLFLLAHDGCHPRPLNSYYINLERIDNGTKAVEWTIHLHEKSWFNIDGWVMILESLFGRISV